MTWKRFLQRSFVLLTVIFLVISGIITIYLGGTQRLTLGPDIEPQPEAPKEFQKGSAKIIAYDPLNNKYVDAKVELFYYENETQYNSTVTNVTLNIPESSIALLSADEYNNYSFSVYAYDNGSIYTNIVYLYKISNTSEINLQISSIDGIVGIYNVSDIPNGTHTITFNVALLNNSKDTTRYGSYSYIPESKVPTNSYADNYSYPSYSNWLVFNCTNLTDVRYKFELAPWINITSVFIVSNNNITIPFFMIFTSLTIKMEANFTNVNDLYMHTGFMDDYNRDVVKVS